jgi:hypothetical protein
MSRVYGIASDNRRVEAFPLQNQRSGLPAKLIVLAACLG